jgi:hypothetical protein
MTYYAKPNYIQYDEWFDENIDPMDLVLEKEKIFSNSVDNKFYTMSRHNLIIGGSELVEDLNPTKKCSDHFCPLSDEELKIL